MRYFVAVLTVIAAVEGAVTTIECEKVELTSDEPENGYSLARGYLFSNSYEGCFMNNYTVTDADDPRISTLRDLSVGGIRFDNNKNIQFLPVLVYRTFPNLRLFIASNCSLREVSKKNFQQLNKLEKLQLEGNKIEKIPSDAFEGLVQLEKVYLNDNRIKSLNGKLFERVFALQIVDLQRNECIDQVFNDKRQLQSLPQAVSKKCGFDESGTNAFEVSCEKTAQCSWFMKMCCFMSDKTSIFSANITVSFMANEGVDGMWFEKNKAIRYLPINIYEVFPNIREYWARECAIKAIFKKNFRKLTQLKELFLSNNFIDTVPSNAFEDLIKLRWVRLEDNRIKQLNGRAFDRLPVLDSVFLRSNLCIDEDFFEIPIKEAIDKITAKCGFNETDVDEPDFETTFPIKCGTASFSAGLIKNGDETKPGQWPFLVALFRYSLKQFFCGGNLISSRHVLTAAHCIHQKRYYNGLNASDIVAYIGRYNIKTGNERESAVRLISKAIVHPDWKSYERKYDADIAILFLNHPVRFSLFIRPVCMTNEAAFANSNEGFVVGWGKSESLEPHEHLPRQVSTKAVTDAVCFEQDSNLGKIYSRRTFCGGGQGAGPCSGDSGGGFFVDYKGFWTLKGIVSAGSYNNATLACDVDRFALYTKVSEFTAWVRQTVLDNL